MINHTSIGTLRRLPDTALATICGCGVRYTPKTRNTRLISVNCQLIEFLQASCSLIVYDPEAVARVLTGSHSVENTLRREAYAIPEIVNASHLHRFYAVAAKFK